jgi:hypothetical protein
MAMVGYTHHPALQKLGIKDSCLFVYYGFTSRTGYAPYDWAKDANALQCMFESKVNRKMLIGVEEEAILQDIRPTLPIIVEPRGHMFLFLQRMRI